MKLVKSAIVNVTVAFSAILLSGCLPQPRQAPSASPTTATTTTTTPEPAQKTNVQTSETTQTESNKTNTDFPTSVSVRFPPGFPLPRYPGAKVITAQQVPKQQQLAMLLTTDDTPKVAQYYRNVLGQQGWSMQKSQMKAAPGTEVLTASKPGQLAVVSVVRNENLTRIDIVVSPNRR